jgi:hypothetical protein
MSNNIESTCSKSDMLSRVLPLLGCSWNTNEALSGTKREPTKRSPEDRMPCHKLYYTCFSVTESLGDSDGEEQGTMSSAKREDVQSKASNLMARKLLFCRSKSGETSNDSNQQQQAPRRVMLENIVDSFDQLVDARIRAYARILRNHVQVLSESNNIRGARITEYKLQTLLEIAANHVLFDTISTEFKVVKGVNEQEDASSLPIELLVEIKSPRFYQGVSDDEDQKQPARKKEGKLHFRAKGVVKDFANYDNGSCSIKPEQCDTTARCQYVRNNSSEESIGNSCLESSPCIEVHINCEDLLSQMIKEASKVVSMAIELTNLAWKNNTQKQQELNNMNRNNTRNIANIIADDDCDSPGPVLQASQRLTAKRSRFSRDNAEHYHQQDDHHDSGMSHKVSELSLHPPALVVCDEEHHLVHSPTIATTITNIDVVHRHMKAKFFVSVEPSFESSSSSDAEDSDHQTEHEHEGCNDECYSRFLAERARHIVDFALADDVIPAFFSSNKRLRTK